MYHKGSYLLQRLQEQKDAEEELKKVYAMAEYRFRYYQTWTFTGRVLYTTKPKKIEHVISVTCHDIGTHSRTSTYRIRKDEPSYASTLCAILWKKAVPLELFLFTPKSYK